MTFPRTNRNTLYALVICLIGIAITGCSQSGDIAYVDLYNKFANDRTWGTTIGMFQTIKPKILEDGVNQIFGKKDLNYDAGIGSLLLKMGSGNSKKWMDAASAIWDIKDKGLRESRNYLLLALKSSDLAGVEYGQLFYRQMMSDERLPADFVTEKVKEMAATASVAQESFARAGQLVDDYKKKHGQ